MNGVLFFRQYAQREPTYWFKNKLLICSHIQIHTNMHHTDLEVLGVAALEEDLVVVAQVEGQEGVQVEDQGGDLEEVREAEVEAADP